MYGLITMKIKNIQYNTYNKSSIPLNKTLLLESF